MKQLTRRFRPSGRRPVPMAAHGLSRSALARIGALPAAVLVAMALSACASSNTTSLINLPNGQPNCFSCHDTRRVVDDQDPTKKLLPPALLNVSHVMSRYIDQQKASSK